jgi:hypothetical protein
MTASARMLAQPLLEKSVTRQRVVYDRDVFLVDVTHRRMFQHGGAIESDWFNWDVVAHALGIKEKPGTDQILSILENIEVVLRGFSRENWASTRDLMLKVEADKRRQFMDGTRVLVHV